MERLLDFTNGELDSLRELVTLYIDQTTTQIGQIAAAVQAGAPGDVRRVAHSCAGASATCGMRRLVPLLRELERQGYEGKLTNAAELSRQVSDEFECIRKFLEAYLASRSNLAAKG
jgi:HPt (histidine-containing phosphotransfer) domain-containing protein